MEAVLFYLFSALAVGSALLVLFVPRPTRALLSLIIMMVALTVLYILLGAHFIAIAQIIVYAGAVLVLFLFVIMLQGIGAKDIPLSKRFHPVLAGLMAASAGALLALLIAVMERVSFPPLRGAEGTVEAVGRLLFTEFLLPFELTALLLLLSIFSAVALAKKEDS